MNKRIEELAKEAGHRYIPSELNRNQMTDEEILQHYNNLKEQYGEKLPNPEHEPIQFQQIVKLYKYYNLTDKTTPYETKY